MRRLRLTPFGCMLIAMGIATFVLVLVGEHTVAWLVAIFGLLLLAAAYMPKSARTNALDNRFRSRSDRR